MALIRVGALVCVLSAATTGPAQEWWSLQPLRQPKLPTVSAASWLRQPQDAFVLAKLEAAGLRPAPAADRITLIRRLTFDLLGLPPTPAEIDAFQNDSRPDAYERLAARLLASPHYGERWGRHWLDVARFSESQGFERDKIRDHAWRYRDYVIASLNSDKPYDRFVREQLAGDVLPESTSESVIATGFLVAGPYDEAGNGSASALLRERIREEELEDIISAVSQTFLGLTVNCARCHDHKFDPIPARDYYRLHSVFAGIKHGDRSVLSPLELRLRQERQAELKREIAACESAIARLEMSAREKLNPRHAAWPADLPKPMARWTFEGDARDVLGSLHGTLHGQAKVRDGRLVLNGRDAYAQTAPLATAIRAKTLEAWVVMPNRAQRGGGVISIEAKAMFDALVFAEQQPRKWLAGSEFFRRTRALDGPDEDSPHAALIHVALVYGSDGHMQMFRNGKPYGVAYKPDSSPQLFPAGAVVLFGLRHHGGGNAYFDGEIEEARLFDRALTEAEVAESYRAGVAALSRAEMERALTPAEQQRYTELLRELDALHTSNARIGELPSAYAANTKQPNPTALLQRGDVERKGEVIAPGALSAVTTLRPEFGLPPDAPEGDRRRRFADWVVSPRNPLTARTIVNRVWHYHFGRGIVGTPNDLGVNGERPSHPEMLDWLAVDFIAHDWSLKHLHQRIVLSATYQQSAQHEARAAASDADNRLLWRFTPQRLEAEAVRDTLLAVGGNLNHSGGGPGYRPFNVTVFNSSFYNLIDEDRPEFFRRTVYRIGVQSAKQPLLEAFDCPEPSVKTPRRNVTTTPLQALGLMNNPFVQRQARLLAERANREAGPKLHEQIAHVFRLALGRLPSEAELQRLAAITRAHGLETVCWAVLNSSEFLYIR